MHASIAFGALAIGAAQLIGQLSSAWPARCRPRTFRSASATPPATSRRSSPPPTRLSRASSIRSTPSSRPAPRPPVRGAPPVGADSPELNAGAVVAKLTPLFASIQTELKVRCLMSCGADRPGHDHSRARGAGQSQRRQGPCQRPCAAQGSRCTAQGSGRAVQALQPAHRPRAADAQHTGSPRRQPDAERRPGRDRYVNLATAAR